MTVTSYEVRGRAGHGSNQTALRFADTLEDAVAKGQVFEAEGLFVHIAERRHDPGWIRTYRTLTLADARGGGRRRVRAIQPAQAVLLRVQPILTRNSRYLYRTCTDLDGSCKVNLQSRPTVRTQERDMNEQSGTSPEDVIERIDDILFDPPTKESELYEIAIVGETGHYFLRGGLAHSPEQVAQVFEDLLGYRQSFILEALGRLGLKPGDETTELGGSMIETACIPLRISIKRCI